MTSSLVLLHGFFSWGGWGSFGNWSPEKWGEYIKIKNFWNNSVYFPQSPHLFYNWKTPQDIPRIYNYVNEMDIPTPLYIGGFSDGAPLAFRFAMRFPEIVSGVIFHSGRINIQTLPKNLPGWKLLVCWGERDLTSKIPFLNSNSDELYQKYKHLDKVNRYIHCGRHKWDSICSCAVSNWACSSVG